MMSRPAEYRDAPWDDLTPAEKIALQRELQEMEDPDFTWPVDEASEPSDPDA